jgi:AcrR family transcriptional regulator
MDGSAEKPVDRRVQRTKRLLTQALIELILEKGYENVTVQDILERANVGRATFYTHYENKDLLLVDGHRNLGLRLFDESVVLSGEDEAEFDFSALLEHVAGNLNLGKALLDKKSGEIFMSAFREEIANVLQARLKPRYARSRRDRMALVFISRAVASGIVSLITSWVSDDLSLSVQEMNQMAQALARSALRV